jgi:exosortase/archaeosortase family protein
MPDRRLRPLVLATLALATAALQLLVAAGWTDRTEYVGTLAVGWAGALWLALVLQRRPLAAAPRVQLVAGAALWLAACAAVVLGRAAYALPFRFLPVLAGAGLAVMASGLRDLPHRGRELLLLALPLASPLPSALRAPVMPTRLTAAAAALLVRLLGTPAERHGALVVMPDAKLLVLDRCSGLALITQMLVLAALALCLFPTTWRRALGVTIAAVAAGFAVNAARVAFLAIVASRTPTEFDYLEQYVAGSVLFPVGAALLAGVAWWRILRRRPQPVTPPGPHTA